MKKSMIITAITVGYLVRDFVTHYNYVKNDFESNLFTLIIIGSTFWFLFAYNEVKSYIKDKKSDEKRQKIDHIDCERMRKIQEFKKERSEFFEAYFKQSSIQMKTK